MQKRDGSGFSPAKNTEGFGLIGMRERATNET
jgi:signal transduction histidine kinase